MVNDSNPKKLTGSATNTLGSIMCYGIGVNKTLTGTVTVYNDTTNIAQFAIGTTPNTYHAIPNGVRYSNLVVVLSAGDDVSSFVRAV